MSADFLKRMAELSERVIELQEKLEQVILIDNPALKTANQLKSICSTINQSLSQLQKDYPHLAPHAAEIQLTALIQQFDQTINSTLVKEQKKGHNPIGKLFRSIPNADLIGALEESIVKQPTSSLQKK
jgi:NAD-specific glutamate dehydrogenase